VEYAGRPHQHPAEAAAPVAAAGGGAPAAHALGHLLVATDGRTVQEVTLRLGRMIVGRTPDNDVQIDSRFISRHHCQVITKQNSCVIEDLNSTNGIYVNSNRVRRHYLNDGDVVLVGKHELLYVDERTPRSREPHVDTVPDVSSSHRAAPVAGPDATGENEELDEDADLDAAAPQG
jgi:general secretion pathway protein A